MKSPGQFLAEINRMASAACVRVSAGAAPIRLTRERDKCGRKCVTGLTKSKERKIGAWRMRPGMKRKLDRCERQ